MPVRWNPFKKGAQYPLRDFRIFISSTSEDLRPYREAAFSAVQQLGGSPDDMHYWPADSQRPLDTCLERIKDCHAVILLVAHRYGDRPPGEERSFVELEYCAARDLGLPILAFFLDPKHPWPPDFIEYEHRAELDRFKDRVRKDLTCTIFCSPEQLRADITTSLVSLALRATSHSRTAPRFDCATKIVSPVTKVLHQPDVTIDIGPSPEGLSMVLSIERSIDVRTALNQALGDLARSGLRVPEALVSEFDRAIKDYGAQPWAEGQITSVCMRDRSERRMYVTQRNLSDLFSPLLSTMLRHRTVSRARRNTLVLETSEIESVGGKNRFLGVCLDEGTVFSVGTRDTRWIEWRPSIFENLIANYPDAVFKIWTTPREFTEGRLSELPGAIQEISLLLRPNEQGEFDIRGNIYVPRQSLALTLDKISEEVASLNDRGKIHGDLKPENILLSSTGPTIVDSFNVSVGDIAPGWTPRWSAPEQMLCRPLDHSSDVYPLGMMLASLLGGQLAGEVRKFRAPTSDGSNTKDYDLFYDPIVHLPNPNANGDRVAASRWIDLAMACLRFDPTSRIPSAREFAHSLRSLLSVEQPLVGQIAIPFPSHSPLQATSWYDGRQAIAVNLYDHPVNSDRTSLQTIAEDSHVHTALRPESADASSLGRTCPRGHSMDPYWTDCPYCAHEDRNKRTFA